MRLFLSFVLVLQSLSVLNAWETAISGIVVSPPAQGPDGRIYSCADDRALHCLDEETGKEYWAYRPGRRLSGYTVVSPDGRILIRTDKEVLVCVSPGGRELWRYQLKGELRTGPAVDVNGTVYLLHTSGILRCLSRQGREVWAVQPEINCRDIFALEKGVLLLGTEQSIFLGPDGSVENTIDIAFSCILYHFPYLYARTADGDWSILDTDTLKLRPGENPLAEGILFPAKAVLITSTGRIVSGREDWFIQAMEAGEDAYDPYYQFGGNPLRSRGVDRIPNPEGRRKDYRKGGSNLLLPLINSDTDILNSYIARYEKAGSLQELMALDYNYDLNLYDILAEANRVSANAIRIRADSYSRNRIYRILTRWGDPRLRESLLLLARMEDEPYNQALIMNGLGQIGLDEDGRSMDTVVRICRRYPLEPDVLNSAVINAARLARYNGGRRILEMMELYSTLQNRSLPASTQTQIRREMHAF